MLADQGKRSRHENPGSEPADPEGFFVLPSEAAENIRRAESRRTTDGGEYDQA